MDTNLGFLSSGAIITLVIILVNLAFFLALPVLVSTYVKRKLYINENSEA